MTRAYRFVDSFWDSDFCGVQGYETLQKFMRDCKQQCRDVEEFFKNRAKIEEDYGKALMKLGKPQLANPSSTMSEALRTLLEGTSLCGQDHMNMAKAVYEASNRVNIFLSQQRDIRKQHEEIVRKSQRKKSDNYKKTLENKRKNDAAYKESRDLDYAMAIAGKAVNQGGKDAEKERLAAKMKKNQADIVKFDQLYKESIDACEDSRKQWERDMTTLCEEFERLEEERLTYLRNELWSYTNVCSITCVDVDANCEKVRLALEACNIDNDLTNFIKTKSTGHQRPAPVVYERYGSPGAGGGSSAPKR